MEGGKGTTMTVAEKKETEEATAVAIVVIVVPSESEADAVNADDVDNLEVPLTYFVQSLTSVWPPP